MTSQERRKLKKRIKKQRLMYNRSMINHLKNNLKANGIVLHQPYEIIEASEKLLNITPELPQRGQGNLRLRARNAYTKLTGNTVPEFFNLPEHSGSSNPPRKQETKRESYGAGNKFDKFYKTHEWKKLRYVVLKKYKGECMLCHRSDLPLHVDHIKPIRKHWSLRLDITNLQVLCQDCNYGKGSWDEADFRPPIVVVRPRIIPIIENNACK
jgi:5-methylcytosine-specific restriction endonuclease McrA